MWLKIGIAVVVVIVVIVGFIAMQPAAFKIARSTTVAAAPASVFANINDLHRFNAWNPWTKIDPRMQQTYEGPAAGEGAAYSWSGNNQVGSGKMTIVKSQAPDLVRMQLDFMTPMKATNMADFALKPEGQNTVVTWAMTGDLNFAGKAIHLVMNMDKMVGSQFEKGLADLKTLSESGKK